MRWMTGLLALMVACDGSTDTDATDATDATDTTDTGDYTVPTDDPTTDGVDRSAALGGRIVDADGNPIEGVRIRFCLSTVCRNGSSNAAGEILDSLDNVGFDDVEVDQHAFEVRPPLEDEGTIAVGYVPLVFETDQTRDVTITLPTLDPATPIPGASTQVEIGSGLFVTLGPSDLTPPLFEDEATQVAGVQVGADDFPPVDFDGGTVIAMWYLDPFDHVAEAGLPVSFTNSWGLAEGATYEVWQGSYKEQAWLERGTVTVNGGTLSGDATLGLLSTTVLVEPAAE